MFMECRQHNSSRLLKTPSICYDTCVVYSDLLIVRNIYAIMEFYVDHSVFHFMRLCRKGRYVGALHETHTRLFSSSSAHIYSIGRHCALFCYATDCNDAFMLMDDKRSAAEGVKITTAIVAVKRLFVLNMASHR